MWRINSCRRSRGQVLRSRGRGVAVRFSYLRCRRLLVWRWVVRVMGMGVGIRGMEVGMGVRMGMEVMVMVT